MPILDYKDALAMLVNGFGSQILSFDPFMIYLYVFILYVLAKWCI